MPAYPYMTPKEAFPLAKAAALRAVELRKKQYVMSYRVACAYAVVGDRDQAFAELDRALDEHDWQLQRIKVDPFMDPLRDDPRFKEMLKRMNLPE